MDNRLEWQATITQWLEGKRSIKQYASELTQFFDQVMKESVYPERAFFGTNKDTISIVIGNLYLGVYIHSGKEKGCSIIVDRTFIGIDGVICTPVLSTLAIAEHLRQRYV